MRILFQGNYLFYIRSRVQIEHNHETYVTDDSKKSGGASGTSGRPLAPKRTFKEKIQAKLRSKANREATKQDVHTYAKEFKEAKTSEFISWAKENQVFEFVDMRKTLSLIHISSPRDPKISRMPSSA